MKIIEEMPIRTLIMKDTELDNKKTRVISRDELLSIMKLSVNKVKDHCTIDPNRFYLEDYPEEYAYLPSVWNNDGGDMVVLLEECH